MSDLPANLEDTLFGELKDLIVRARERVAVQVNQALVMTYWQIGRKLTTEVLQRDSHRYGEATMTRLAERLTLEFGGGFAYPNLYRMVKFFLKFPDPEILATLSTKFSWSHFLEFIKIEDPLKRDFYVQVCSSQAWSVRQLRREMNSLLFERTMLSRQPEGVIRQELANLESNPAELSPSLFLKDPYLLDFLDLKGHFSEKDLENAILHELERFILEMGSDFAFIGRQRRIQVGGSDFYIDLLFYHSRSSSARTGTPRSWSCWTWRKTTFTSRSTGCSCRPGRCCRRGCTRPWSRGARGWSEREGVGSVVVVPG